MLARSRVAVASNGFSLKLVAHSIPDCLDLFLLLAPFLPPFFFLACRATIDPLQLAPPMLMHDALLVWQGRKATDVEQQEMAATAVRYRILLIWRALLRVTRVNRSLLFRYNCGFFAM